MWCVTEVTYVGRDGDFLLAYLAVLTKHIFDRRTVLDDFGNAFRLLDKLPHDGL